MLKKNIQYCLSLILFLITQPAFASLEIGEPFIRNFTSEEYDGGSQVWAVAEDHRGVMYFGTGNEILEFDGTNWRRLEIPNNATIRSLEKDADGKIYVGGSGEMGYLASDSKGQMTYKSLNDKLPKDYGKFKDVWSIFVTSHGVYFCTSKEVFRWHSNQLHVLPELDSMPVKISDKLYCYTKKGIAVLSKDGVSYLTDKPFDKDEYGIIWLFPFPKKDRILVSSRKKGLFFFPIESNNAEGAISLQKFQNQADDFLIEHLAYSATTLQNNLMVLGTRERGIVILNTDGELVRVINANHGLLSNSIWAVKEDRHHNLWVCMQGGIAHVEINSPLTIFSKKSGIPSSASSVTRHQGTVYAGTFNIGPMKLPTYELNLKGDAHRFVSPTGPTSEYGWSFLEVDDTLIVASKPLRRIDDGIISDIKETPVAYSMCASKKFEGRIYVGISELNDGGVGVLEYRTEVVPNGHRSQNTVIEYKGKLDGITEIIRKVSEDDEGNLWLSTQYSGVIYVKFNSEAMDDFEVKRYTQKHGLPVMESNNVYLDKGRVLVATQKGLYQALPTSKQNGEGIHFSQETSMNGALAKAEEGIAILAGYGENRWLVQPLITYGLLERELDGSYRCDSRPFRAVIGENIGYQIDPDGVVWIPSSKGVYRYDPKTEKNYEAPYAVLVRNVKTNFNREIFKGTNYDPVSIADNLYHHTTLLQPKTLVPTMAYEENGLTFEFSALFYEHMGKTTYHVTLEGLDKDWSEWSNKTLREYTNIPEGTYTFKVQAKNIYDTISSEATYRFKILPPWYRTWYAYIGYVLAFFLSMYGGIRLNTRRLIVARNRLKKIVKKRTREIAEKKDQLEIAYNKVNETKNALWGEMELAKKIQTVLLPEDPRIPGYEITGYMQTADEVGGDYYDVINVEGKHWLIIGDVSGHGVPAGLVVALQAH